MRYEPALIFILFFLAASGCRGGVTPPLDAGEKTSPLQSAITPTTQAGGITPQPQQTGERTLPLRIDVTPDSANSFRQVAGRVPLTVTFGAEISGGTPPYQVAWDFEGTGKTDGCASCADASSEGPEAKPVTFTFYAPGVYSATVTIKDSAGQTATAGRRIVAFGPPKIPTWKYGVTAHLERRRAGYYPRLEDVTHAVELTQSAGIQAARIDFNWDMINPEQDRWEWQDYDAMVQIVRSHKLDILGILDYSSWWSSSAQSSNDWRVRLYSEPRSVYEYAAYVYQVVSHFKNDVHAWEIWNEPNTVGFWKPQPNAAHYTELLKEAYLAVKYADPTATVLFGGLSGNGVEGDDPSGFASNYIAAAYAAGARDYFDVMSIHPYMLPNSGIDTERAKIAATRAVLDQQGDKSVPIWVTEIGVPGGAPWWATAPLQSDEQVAAWLQQVYTRLWDLTPAIFWYDLQDQGIGDTVEQHFGLLRLDFSPKPAFDKLKQLTKQ